MNADTGSKKIVLLTLATNMACVLAKRTAWHASTEPPSKRKAHVDVSEGEQHTEMRGALDLHATFILVVSEVRVMRSLVVLDTHHHQLSIPRQIAS